MKRKISLILTFVILAGLLVGAPASAYTPPVVINTPSLPDGTVGVPYSVTLNATGGVGAPYTWKAGTFFPLPDGLSIDSSTGEIAGTPTANGTYTTIIWVKDSYGPPMMWDAWRTYTITINNPAAEPEPIRYRDPDSFSFYAKFGFDSTRWTGEPAELIGPIEVIGYYPLGTIKFEIPEGCEISGKPLTIWVGSVTKDTFYCSWSGNVTLTLPMVVSIQIDDSRIIRDEKGIYHGGEWEQLFETSLIVNGEAQ